ncbi:unnamed protein product [Wuchereria bancrofti]|uniref:Uncharacterized protein n=1 Tax=Wuchereria bancrofti TaxID=6293 RepID=A0A3P7EDH3_WUCBA|nr:unnamed protein product [Wuchereria bancrofti]
MHINMYNGKVSLNEIGIVLDLFQENEEFETLKQLNPTTKILDKSFRTMNILNQPACLCAVPSYSNLTSEQRSCVLRQSNGNTMDVSATPQSLFLSDSWQEQESRKRDERYQKMFRSLIKCIKERNRTEQVENEHHECVMNRRLSVHECHFQIERIKDMSPSLKIKIPDQITTISQTWKKSIKKSDEKRNKNELASGGK